MPAIVTSAALGAGLLTPSLRRERRLWQPTRHVVQIETEGFWQVKIEFDVFRVAAVASLVLVFMEFLMKRSMAATNP